MSCSTFINGLKLAGNPLDCKILADIAANDAAGFAALAVQANPHSPLPNQHAKRLPPNRFAPHPPSAFALLKMT